MEKKDTCISCGKELVNKVLVRFGGQEFKVCCKRCEKQFIEDMKEERRLKLKKAEIDLKMRNRELAYKQVQIKDKSMEKNESKLYNLVSFPKDDLKPKFVLENEVDMLNFMIKEKEKEIKNMKELEEQDAKIT